MTAQRLEADEGVGEVEEGLVQHLPALVADRQTAIVVQPREGALNGSIERSFGWLARFRRLARDDERLAQSLAGFHLIVFAILMAARLARLLAQDA